MRKTIGVLLGVLCVFFGQLEASASFVNWGAVSQYLFCEEVSN